MNKNKPKNTFCGQLNRREYLHQMGGGFSSLAMAGLLAKDGFIQSQAVAADGKTPWANPLAPKDPPPAGQGQKCHLPFHVRWPESYGHL